MRFVDQTADESGVVGAAAPAEGKKTRAFVRAVFRRHGEAQRLVYNTYVRYVDSLPEEEKYRAAVSHHMMNQVLIVQKPERFSTKHAVGTEEYDAAKATFDANAARVKAVRDNHFGGKTLLEAHPWLKDVSTNVLTQALRDFTKAWKSNVAKQEAQRQRGERVIPFRVGLKDPRDASSLTFYVLAATVKATHVPRPDLYRVPSKKDATRAAAGETSGLAAHRAAQPRRRQWTKLVLPSTFYGGGRSDPPVVVYLTRCADLTKEGKLLGDVRFTCDSLGRWHCVVQRTPRAVRPLRPVAERCIGSNDPGVTAFATCYGPGQGAGSDQAKLVTYGTGQGGVERIMPLLFKADDIITRLRKLKLATNFSVASEKKAYEATARHLRRQKLNCFNDAKNLIKEMHCRVARDLTANFDTIMWPVRRLLLPPLS